MADVKKTVEIVFGGKNEMGKTIDDIGRSFGKLDDLASKVADPLANIANSVVKTDAALLSMAVGGMAYAIREAGLFGGKFGEITTLISDTGAPIEKFKADIKNYAVDSVKSINDINQAIYTSVSAGVDYKKSIEFVNVAEKLSVAGRSELGDTTKALISTLNAYGQSTDKAGNFADVMFTTVKLGLTTMTELSASLAQVTGLAANSGIPFETLSAAIAALTTTGMPTAQAITSIKAAIQNIIKPTGEAETMAKSLGLQFNATALKTKGFEGVLWNAQKATKGNVEKMAELFGSVEALNAVMVLAADKNGKFKSSLEEIKKSAGATQVAYDKVANEFANINQRMENSFKITLVEIGEKLMPQYGKIAGALGDLMKGIKVGVDSGAFDPFFIYLDSVGTSIAKWLNDVAKAFPDVMKNVDFNGLIAALQDIPDEAPTGAQLDYAKDLGITIPEGVTKEEISDLIAIKVGNDKPSSIKHRALAKHYGIECTEYVGKKELFDRILSTLKSPGKEQDLAAWFTYRVYRELMHGVDDAPIDGPDHALIREIAGDLMKFDNVLTSIRRYEGRDIIWFGEWAAPNGQKYSGGSDRTIAYKMTSAALRQHLDFPESAKKTTAEDASRGTSTKVHALLRICKDCGMQISKSAGRCPHCGARHDYGSYAWALIITIGLVAFMSMVFQCGK